MSNSNDFNLLKKHCPWNCRCCLAHTHTLVYFTVFTLLLSHPPTAKINLCVCVFLSRHTGSFILEAVITGIVQTSTTASLTWPSWTRSILDSAKRKKTQLPWYSSSLQSGLQCLCNTHLGMLKNLKLDHFKEYLCNTHNLAFWKGKGRWV